MAGKLESQNVAARRERRFQRQRVQLMDAAARLFAERGYAATTTKDIALAADVGESTLYGYFPGKRDVLLAILSQQAEMIDALFAQVDGLKDRQDFLGLIDAVMERVFAQVPYTRALIAEAWVNDQVMNDYVVARLRRLLRLLEALISDRVAQGVLRPMDPSLGARVILGSFLGVILPQLRGVDLPPSPARRRELAETILALLLDGIAAQRATGALP